MVSLRNRLSFGRSTDRSGASVHTPHYGFEMKSLPLT